MADKIITKLTVPGGTTYVLQDKDAQERISEIDKVTATALNDLNDRLDDNDEVIARSLVDLNRRLSVTEENIAGFSPDIDNRINTAVQSLNDHINIIKNEIPRKFEDLNPLETRFKIEGETTETEYEFTSEGLMRTKEDKGFFPVQSPDITPSEELMPYTYLGRRVYRTAIDLSTASEGYSVESNVMSIEEASKYKFTEYLEFSRIRLTKESIERLKELRGSTEDPIFISQGIQDGVYVESYQFRSSEIKFKINNTTFEISSNDDSFCTYILEHLSDLTVCLQREVPSIKLPRPSLILSIIGATMEEGRKNIRVLSENDYHQESPYSDILILDNPRFVEGYIVVTYTGIPLNEIWFDVAPGNSPNSIGSSSFPPHVIS